ncbi:MAG: NfeD family protein [Eubacterium sp.]|nr:NfeD family protein [Eubacterium sp.]
MEYMLWVWLGAFLVFIAFELISLGLTTIWFAIGALVAEVVYLCGGGLILQLVVFFVVSIAVLLLVRPYAVKYFNTGTKKTNIEALEGKTAKVVETIDNIASTGRVFVDGVEWAAKCENDQIIEKDSLVTIKKIQGVKLIVEKK